MNEVSARSVGAAVESGSGPDLFTLRQRIVLRMIAWVGYWVIRLIGPTLRVGISREEGAPETLEQRPVIASFWHACIIPATYMFRGLGVRVLSSNSYDGEYTGRIIRKFGFVPVKGSSRRNAVPALLGLRHALAAGSAVAFTLDGPKGPRYKVRLAPVALGKSTAVPLATFHIAVEMAWVLNTWDGLIIPKPFSRVLMRMGRMITVPSDASGEDLERLQAELQASLDRVREFAEANVGRVGSAEFPYFERAA